MADNNSGFTPKPRKKNALDNRKLTLSAPCPTAQGKRSALIWGVYGNNPRITVYTGDPEDSTERTGYGKIIAKLDVTNFFMFVEMLEAVAKSPTEMKQKIDIKDYTWLGGKRSEQPQVVCSVALGKDADGGIWISVIAEKRPLIKFYILPSEMTSLYHGDGRPFTKSETSALFTLGYCQILRNLVSIVLVNEYVEEAPKKPFGQGGNNNNNNTGGYNRQPAPPPAQETPYPDDIPF